MKIRPASTFDAEVICDLVNYYAERGRMLHRSLESVYEAMREFYVAEGSDGNILGCVAVDIFWADLAEVKSLAVRPDACSSGAGTELLKTAIEDAHRMGVKQLFALTYEKDFFEQRGFKVIKRGELPEKVWRECIACPKVDACDEIAMMMYLKDR